MGLSTYLHKFIEKNICLRVIWILSWTPSIVKAKKKRNRKCFRLFFLKWPAHAIMGRYFVIANVLIKVIEIQGWPLKKHNFTIY